MNLAVIMDAPIYAKGLRKRYGKLQAVDGVDLRATAGTCLGLLGPNGAGKTTTIEMLEGILQPDEGEIRILGRSWSEHSRDIRRRIGVQLQETRLPEKITVRESLEIFQSFYAKPRSVDSVMELVGLREKASARTMNLSGGQRQRLALGCALISNPEVLFLDEPTTGLDPQARRRVWEIVEEFKASGRTVLLTTHYMEEAHQLADELIILDRGKIIAEGTPDAIIASLGAESIVRLALEPSPDGELRELEGLPGVLSVRRDEEAIELSVRELHRSVPALLEWVRIHQYELNDLHTHHPTLEDVFVALTGRQLRDE